MGRCFVMQPFDKGAFDKRYDDILVPAIRRAGLDPYRVDRDHSARILIDSIEAEVRGADACLADISTDNPNVWYELGYSYAAGKDVVLICSKERAKFPFDVQHRNIISYSSDSPRDFDELGSTVTARLKATMKKQSELQLLAPLSRVEETEGLSANEMAVLISLMENRLSPESSLPAYQIVRDVEKVGYRSIAATLALESLRRKGFVENRRELDMNEEPYAAYAITEKGVQWLLKNQDRLVLEDSPEDIPF